MGASTLLGHGRGVTGSVGAQGAHTGGSRRQGGAQRGGGACQSSAEGPVCGGGGGAGERRGRLGQPSSLGVADRSQGRGGRY